METLNLQSYIFYAPSSITLSGPSSSGKTVVAMEILRHRQTLFSQPVHGVIYCYTEFQQMFNDPPGGKVIFHHGLPSMEELEEYIKMFGSKHFLIIYDDLMKEFAQSEVMMDVATKLSHHRNFSVVNITQNIFIQGKAARSQSLNSGYYILTRTTRDLRQIATLGSQLFPGKSSQFVAAYKDAVDNPFNSDFVPHLLVGCHPQKTVRGCQLLSNIFSSDGRLVLYRL